jgi:large conductance mechanosensitive channel
MLKDFANFIREKGVVGLAVGIIMGGSIGKFVTAIIEDWVNPIIGAITGAAGNLNDMVAVVGGMTFKYGHFISSAIDFIAVLAVVYFAFVKSPLGKMDKSA